MLYLHRTAVGLLEWLCVGVACGGGALHRMRYRIMCVGVAHVVVDGGGGGCGAGDVCFLPQGLLLVTGNRTTRL